MRILFAVIGLALTLSTASQAHRSLVTIKHADKVIVKTGMSGKKMMGMIHCLNTLKKHATAEDAMAAAKEKITAKCEKHAMDDAKCQKKMKKIGRHIYNCYAKAEFFRDYVTPKDAATADADVAATESEKTE